MSVINNGLLLASGADAATTYQISRSLRFNSSDSAYASRVPSSNGTSYTTWTFSCWVKRAALGSQQGIVAAGTNASDYFHFKFTSSDTLNALTGENGATNLNNASTTAVFRDLSAWYHILLQWDFTNATQADRLKIYVNGVRQTVSGAIAAQNYAGTTFNRASIEHCIGRVRSGVEHLNAYLADIHFIDGQALTPSSFGETDATTGAWNPKAYTGSYGTNGFRLPLSDNSGTTSTTLGKDSAGSNNWTPNNFSVASGSGNDSLVDSPTNYGTDTGVGGEVRGNYCTWNPLSTSSQYLATLSNGNLTTTSAPDGTHRRMYSTFAFASGKWYWEVTASSGVDSERGCICGITIANAPKVSNTNGYVGFDTQSWGYASHNGNKATNNTFVSYGATWTNNDIIGVAYDANNGTLSFYKNGVSQGNAYTGLSTVDTYAPIISIASTVTTVSFDTNFGQRAFAYTAPSGFKALCTANLPTPTIAKGSDYFDVKLYTGNGSTQTISGLGFSPDFLWIKNRNFSGYNHHLTDVVRGVTQRLRSNTPGTELTSTDQVTAYNSNGFSLGPDSAGPGDLEVNQSSGTYVAWAWDAGSSTVSNTQGSISSQVRANASAGFSVVTYTGTGANATVGHGLGVAAQIVIVKRRNSTGNWAVWHKALAGTDYLRLNSNAAKGTDATYWNSTIPTSTVFSIGTSTDTNANTGTYVAYCFTSVAGYSSIGNYEAGTEPFVFCGFRPRFIMIKRTASSDGWAIFDTSRTSYNVATARFEADTSNAEGGSDGIDILSNGFKIKTTWGGMGGSTGNGTMAFMAFAENPFAYARAR